MDDLELYNKAFNYALNLISFSNRTTKCIEDKLRQKQYNDEIIQLVIERLKELNYLNDEDYLNNWLSYNGKNSLYSKRQIIFKLQQKGFLKSDIENALDDLEFDESSAIEALVEKKIKNVNDIDKIYRFLVNKGFSYEKIGLVLKKTKEISTKY